MGFGRKMRVSPFGEKRKAHRSPAWATALVETPASRHRLAITDISSSGARVSGIVPVTSRRDLRIRVNGIDVFGIVAWRKDNSFGFKFEEILSGHDPSEISRVVIAAEYEDKIFDRDVALRSLLNTTDQKKPADEIDGVRRSA